MKTVLKNLVLGVMFSFLVASPVLSLVAPQVATVSANCEARFLGIPPWYRGLTETVDGNCTIKSPGDDLSGFIWRIALNVVEMMLVAVAYLSVVFIMYGGFFFLARGNNPASVEKARKSILQATMGLVIAMASIGILNMAFALLGTETDANGIPTLTGEVLLQNALNLAYFIAGVIAIVVIIISGIMYTISGGDAARVTKAKNFLNYAIVGLVVILSAFLLTNIIIGSFNS